MLRGFVDPSSGVRYSLIKHSGLGFRNVAEAAEMWQRRCVGFRNLGWTSQYKSPGVPLNFQLLLICLSFEEALPTMCMCFFFRSAHGMILTRDSARGFYFALLLDQKLVKVLMTRKALQLKENAGSGFAV